MDSLPPPVPVLIGVNSVDGEVWGLTLRLYDWCLVLPDIGEARES